MVPGVETVEAADMEPTKVKLDRYGYFVVVPKADEQLIYVEHYDYENKLLRIIRGKNSRNIYWEIINSGWVSEMSHAAYLGKELARAELSMSLGFKYVQDKG
jgi:tetrahydromethanopterin S-methyltransferase subunit A